MNLAYRVTAISHSALKGMNIKVAAERFKIYHSSL